MRWLGDVAKHCLGRTFGSGRTEKDNAAPTGPFSLHNESEQVSTKQRRRRSSSIYVEGNRKRLSMQSHSNVRTCLSSCSAFLEFYVLLFKTQYQCVWENQNDPAQFFFFIKMIYRRNHSLTGFATRVFGTFLRSPDGCPGV